jgi:hypothetical protein
MVEGTFETAEKASSACYLSLTILLSLANLSLHSLSTCLEKLLKDHSNG